MLSNCGHDENGRYSGGLAGDQTGQEWCLVPWYRYNVGGWQYMIRHPNRTVGQLISDLACEAAANNNIGYDQGERTTFWTQLQRAGYHPDRVTTPCEADCSSGVAALVKAVGYLTGNTAMQSVSADCYTGNIRAALKNAGFEVYADSKYLDSDAYLLPGDFLLREGWHICTNVTAGSESGAESEDDMVLEGIRDTIVGKTVAYFAEVTADELNLRVYPSTDAPLQKWDHFKKGNPVLVVGYDASGMWALVVFNYGGYGSYGWVWKDYLKRI